MNKFFTKYLKPAYLAGFIVLLIHSSCTSLSEYDFENAGEPILQSEYVVPYKLLTQNYQSVHYDDNSDLIVFPILKLNDQLQLSDDYQITVIEGFSVFSATHALKLDIQGILSSDIFSNFDQISFFMVSNDLEKGYFLKSYYGIGLNESSYRLYLRLQLEEVHSDGSVKMVWSSDSSHHYSKALSYREALLSSFKHVSRYFLRTASDTGKIHLLDI